MQMLELANGSMMWLFSGLIIAAAVMQSLVLYRLARKYIRQTNVLVNANLKCQFSPE